MSESTSANAIVAHFINYGVPELGILITILFLGSMRRSFWPKDPAKHKGIFVRGQTTGMLAINYSVTVMIIIGILTAFLVNRVEIPGDVPHESIFPGQLSKGHLLIGFDHTDHAIEVGYIGPETDSVGIWVGFYNRDELSKSVVMGLPPSMDAEIFALKISDGNVAADAAKFLSDYDQLVENWNYEKPGIPLEETSPARADGSYPQKGNGYQLAFWLMDRLHAFSDPREKGYSFQRTQTDNYLQSYLIAQKIQTLEVCIQGEIQNNLETSKGSLYDRKTRILRKVRKIWDTMNRVSKKN